MFSLPPYIEKAHIADRQLLFAWDNSDTYVAEGETDTDLVDRLSRLSERTNVAYAVAVTEWILGRFSIFSGIEDAFLYCEACWAAAIDLRYCRVVWEDFPHSSKWEDPVKGPVRLAMLRLQQTIGSLVEGDDPEYTASKLWQLAVHVSPEPGALERWNLLVLDRMEQFPRIDNDLFGDVVPREFFDPNREVSLVEMESLINRFLKQLNPRENPFLNTPERMIEEGFPDTPYEFNLASDRARRGVKGPNNAHSSRVIAAFFALLAAIFLFLSVTTGTSPAKHTWRRIGIIFGVVALLIIAIQHKLI